MFDVTKRAQHMWSSWAAVGLDHTRHARSLTLSLGTRCVCRVCKAKMIMLGHIS